MESTHQNWDSQGRPDKGGAAATIPVSFVTEKAVPTILIVDDETAVRRLVRLMLQETGYDFLEAEDGLAAYQLIRTRRGALDLVITDMQMPHMTGAELIRRVKLEYPEVKTLCVSGNADSMSPNAHYFLPKPFTRAALRAMVDKVMACAMRSQFARATPQ